MSSANINKSKPALAAKRTPWIVNWWQDMLWFVGPPLFLVPAFWLLLQRIPLEKLSVLVVSFGAVGHHLPGMLRAYGDRELFARYRIRFILAPIFLATVAISFSYYRPHALAVLVLLWGLWHSQAQIYGFLRIYDSKYGWIDRRTALIDRFLCLSWFIGGVMMSDGRVADFLTTFYRSGGRNVSPETILMLQRIALIAIGVSTLLYLMNTASRWIKGLAPNPVKILTLVLSIGFWWYCMVSVRQIILGVALYEVFHDVQYLAIVWFFNQRRAQAGTQAGWLTQFLFRPKARLVFIYLALIAIYGAGSHMTRSMDQTHLYKILTGLYVASGLLHFYYDGFIWRIREKSTGDTLGVQTAQSLPQRVKNLVPGWAMHAAMWGLFVAPLAVLAMADGANNAYGRVVATLPDSARANFNYAVELHKQDDFDAAERHARQALKANENWSKPWALLGEIELSRKHPANAIDYLKQAVKLDSYNAIAHFNLGNALIQLHNIPEGTAAYARAVELDPKMETSTFNNLGSALLDAGAPEDAIGAFRNAVAADPENIKALKNLADTYLLVQDGKGAAEVYLQGLELEPDSEAFLSGAVRAILLTGEVSVAETLLENYAHAFKSVPPVVHHLKGMIAQQRQDFVEAEKNYRQVLEVEPTNFSTLCALALLLEQNGHHEKSVQIVEQLLKREDISDTQRKAAQELAGHLTLKVKVRK